MGGVFLHMAEFAFLFYPGDYLRDTQCLSEKVQVAYDRIMCEHVRNICITQKQLTFFTKKLSTEELDELKSVLIETEDGFYIEWVLASINKRKEYSQSRSANRKKKTSLTYDKDMITYDNHMEIEKEIEKELVKEVVKEVVKKKKVLLTKETINEVISSIDNNLHPLQIFIETNCKNISKMTDQLTHAQASKLWEQYDHQVLGDVILSMENKADLLKKYASVYLTIYNWAKNQKSHGKTNSNSSENRFADLEQQLERTLQGTKFDI